MWTAEPEVGDFADIYAAYRQPLTSHLCRLVSDRETAEDLCQETFVKAMRHWHKHDPEASVGAWLYRIATNTAYDHLRRRRRIAFQPLDSDDMGAPIESPERAVGEREPIERALAQIPPLYRLPLVLHSRDGHSTQEIAIALGCSTSAVKTRLFRARARFREVYQS